MKLTVLVADSAQADPSSGKVHTLGLGWDLVSTPTPPMSLVIFFTPDSPNQERLPRQLEITGRLLDADGTPAEIQSGTHVGFTGQFETEEERARAAVVINLPQGFPLKPGVYSWEICVEELSLRDGWWFTVTEPPNPTSGAGVSSEPSRGA
ncbi:DUF6941 family protein [Nocardia sp. NPDC003482]